jgi:tyrosine aminotransferase
MSDWKPLIASHHAQNTTNPIRKIVDQMKPTGAVSTKPMIALSIGDPTTDGNLLPPSTSLEALCEVVKSCKFNGYPPSVGFPESRAAVAKYWINNFSKNLPDAASFIKPETVILGSGASQAIVMAITALCNPGDNLILPSPCFSLYSTICDSYGIKVKYYKCSPETNWECDLDSIRAAADSNTKGILINNPSNPCGSNFSRTHVKSILDVAEELRLPIIADEIYSGMVFGDDVFTSAADFDSVVPRIVVGGTAKNFVAPGWRLGWAIMVDKLGVAASILDGMVALSTLIVGPNSLIQAALDNILNGTEASYRLELNRTLEKNAMTAFDIFSKCKGLKPTTPQGAMYMMIGIDVDQFKDISNGIEFAKMLLTEENVQVLPGEIFQMPNYFRVVCCKPVTLIEEAAKRVEDFCTRHSK